MAYGPHVNVCLTLLYVTLVSACLSGGRSSMRGRPGRPGNREPLVYGQYVPNRSELSIVASGEALGKITRGSKRYDELVDNQNTDIVFKDEEGTGADRMMTQKCKDKLDSLAIMVMNQWPGVKLRVTEGWDEDELHASDSLHYEGRAVDITTSDRDKLKLSLLARLAYDAGFDYVSYESRHHIHCSVKSDDDSSSFGSSAGCFAEDSFITMEDNSQKYIQNLQINDRVLSVSPYTGEVTTDIVFMFLDRDETSNQKFTEIVYQDGKITLTDYHLIYMSTDSVSSITESKSIFAKDVKVNHTIYVNMDDNITTAQRVIEINTVIRKGYYAPVTLSGNILVNGVASSCYASIDRHWLAHVALFPLRVVKHLSDVICSVEKNCFLESLPPVGVHWYGQLLSHVFPFLLT